MSFPDPLPRAVPRRSITRPNVARPLRIAHVVNEPFSGESASGVQQAVYCLAGAQVGIGESVAVFSRESGVHLLDAGAERCPGTPDATRRNPGTSLRGRLLWRYLRREFTDGVLGWSPDIVHFHSVHIPENVALAETLTAAGVPYCVTVHGGLFAAALRRNRFKKAVFRVMFEREYLNRARFIHAVSPHEIAGIRQQGVYRPVVVVPNGLPPGAFAEASRPDALFASSPWLGDRRVFMFVGRLEPWQKGLDLLVRAFSRAGLRNAALVLVGPDCRGSRRTLEALVDRHDIRDRVVFTGAAFGEDRANLLAAADIFVHPSRWEGLSLSVLAAAAAGKPCLLTRDADPLGELARADAALTVDATVESIAAGLRRAAALSHPELRAMGARARYAAESRFTWTSVAPRLVEACREALEDGDEAHSAAAARQAVPESWR